MACRTAGCAYDTCISQALKRFFGRPDGRGLQLWFGLHRDLLHSTIETSGYKSALYIRTLLRLKVSIPRRLESPIIRGNETLLSYLAVKMRQHFWRYVGFRF